MTQLNPGLIHLRGNNLLILLKLGNEWQWINDRLLETGLKQQF